MLIGVKGQAKGELKMKVKWCKSAQKKYIEIKKLNAVSIEI